MLGTFWTVRADADAHTRIGTRITNLTATLKHATTWRAEEALEARMSALLRIRANMAFSEALYEPFTRAREKVRDNFIATKTCRASGIFSVYIVVGMLRPS